MNTRLTSMLAGLICLTAQADTSPAAANVVPEQTTAPAAETAKEMTASPEGTTSFLASMGEKKTPPSDTKEQF